MILSLISGISSVKAQRICFFHPIFCRRNLVSHKNFLCQRQGRGRTLCDVWHFLCIYNHGQKSWDKFTFGTLSSAPNKQSRGYSSTLGQPLPPSPRPTMLDTSTRYFSRVSTLYGGGGGGVKATQFKTDNSAFLKLRFENTEN